MNTHPKNSHKKAQKAQKFNFSFSFQFLRLMCLFVAFFEANLAFGYSGGTGEPNDPYQIADMNDLLQLADDFGNYDKSFILTSDINLAGQDFNNAVIGRYDPYIPNSPFLFTGTFNGAGHKIINLTINCELERSLGLFGVVSGEVNNLGLENVSITRNYTTHYCCIGGLAASNSGTINNCYLTGTIISNANGFFTAQIGGLVGWNTGILSNCHSICVITAGHNTSHIGGLAADIAETSIIINCWAASTITTGAFSGTIGGLVGQNLGGYIIAPTVIMNCYSTGTIQAGEGSGYIGGLIGLSFDFSYIKKCYSTMDITSQESSIYLGGLVGGNSCDINNCYSTGNVAGGIGSDKIGGLIGENIGYINNSYSIGTVAGPGAINIGGLVGDDTGTNAINSSYFLEGSGPDNGLGEPLDDNEMKQCENFAGWDFVFSGCNNGPDYIWFIFEGVDYPQLAWYMGICIVPDVAGMTMYDADNKIIESGFTVGDISYAYSDTVAADCVISQNPAPGQNECGSEVSYVVSKGPWPCEIPNITGLSMSDANSLIIGNDFTVGDISYGYSDAVPEGNVISQNPAPGPSEECDLAISYIASSGPIPDNNTVPDYDDNGIVNFADFAIFAYAWMSENSLIDLTGDNYINIYDLKLFCGYWLEEQ